MESVNAMLQADPGLANARREKTGFSAVITALFAIRKGEESFPDPATNATLHAILERKPELDMFEIAAVGTSQQLEKVLRDELSTLIGLHRQYANDKPNRLIRKSAQTPSSGTCTDFTATALTPPSSNFPKAPNMSW